VPASKREVVNTLCSKLGARVEYNDHEFYYIEESGKRLGWAKVSHGPPGKTIEDWVLSKIARTLGLTPPQFRQFLACTKFRDDYVGKICRRHDHARGI